MQTVPIDNPAFIGFHPSKPVLYASQSATNDVDLTGTVVFHIDAQTGLLRKSEAQFIQHKAVCCFDIAPSGKYMVQADFSGMLEVFLLDCNGVPYRKTDTVQLGGNTGPLSKIQKSSRPHHIKFDILGKNIVVPDKGLDLVHIFRLADLTGKLEHVRSVPVRPASCVRHVSFHPNNRFVYINAEYTSKIYVFEYDCDDGSLNPVQILSTERPTYTGLHCLNSEVQVHPSGRFLYVSNRGDNTICRFLIDELSGALHSPEWYKCGGDSPRYFSIENCGRNLIVGNQKSGSITVFLINPQNGSLSPAICEIQVDCPTWMLYLRKEGL